MPFGNDPYLRQICEAALSRIAPKARAKVKVKAKAVEGLP